MPTWWASQVNVPGLAQVVDDDLAGVGQSGVAGCWQGEGLDVGAAEPVVQDGPDPSRLGGVRLGSVQAMMSSRSRPVTVTTVGEMSGSGASFAAEPDDVERCLPVDTVFVPDPCRDPDGTIAGSDPGSLLGPDGHNPGADVDQLMVVVPVAIDDIASGVGVDLGGGHWMVAVLRH